MDVLTFETCWAANSEIIKQVTSSWSIFIQLSNTGCLSSGHDMYCTWARTREDPLLLFKAKKGQQAKEVWKALLQSMFAFSQIFLPRTECVHIIFGNTHSCVLIDAVSNCSVIRQMRELCVQSALSTPSSFAVHCIWFFFSFVLCQVISVFGMSC